MNDAIYLTPDEIKQIHHADLSGTMAKIRDFFVIGCVTGLRFSDYSRFGPGYFKSGVIIMLTKKTAKKVVIPAHKFVLEVLQRNKMSMPKPPTGRYFNMMLPKIGSIAGIRDLVDLDSVEREGKDGERVVVSRQEPKFKFITTHTARRSFATNAYLAGIPAAKIMLITGHTTEKSFFRYIRIGARENANELLNHKFFKT